MPRLYFEDFVPGTAAEYGPRTVTREEILAFAAEFDPQPMHLDDAAARATMLGGLAVSGWHSCCLMMRLMADGFLLDSSSQGSPGVGEVRWLKPVRPGDTLTLRASVKEARVSKSRPDVGLVKLLLELLNQRGETPVTCGTTILFGRRPRGGAA
jgi:acyl dehydratase